ncbi:hypothetical protein O163_10050 [Caldanaerobacter subterraneus subsp. yonseiensis KB-1]|uniref:ParB/Sulfiredoxin domain-containing protein n=1 Tax=Caldanaerobacter subterraneus subsp. yonseiensis KB-1 TaxID=1388761 RepID=U5CTR7_CALSX|nr:hypothetical protein [Caldanaerobacter subterraneus]ERM91507.1 hypothetical protein O163_10050 [Caldanaerobacter subterraneus subsp. yonseiensis KB-1]
MPFPFIEPKIEIVKMENIKEYPTQLGNRCKLLRELGLNPYVDTEEEIMEALTEAAETPEYLDICMKSSHCSGFWKKFSVGETPFFKEDPVQLLKYQDVYWVVEGKHRVCFAKRTGVKEIKAHIYELSDDGKVLLPEIGTPGRFAFDYMEVFSSRQEGEKAVLWLKDVKDLRLIELSWKPAVLDKRFDTKGEFVELVKGVKVSVSVKEKTKIFSLKKTIQVHTEIIIEPDHKKTKIWLLKIPAGKPFSLEKADAINKNTLYRYGCWRKHHLEELIKNLM